MIESLRIGYVINIYLVDAFSEEGYNQYASTDRMRPYNMYDSIYFIISSPKNNSRWQLGMCLYYIVKLFN